MKNALDGLIIIDKSQGMTSHDVVSEVRRILHTRKVGHTGTLDPDATGVLPICVGRATKIAQFLLATDKEYEAMLILGVRTDTQDSTGNVLSKVDTLDFGEDEVKAVFSQFVGEIQQIPPMVSAVRYKGVRLYELARKGKEVERTPRKIHIFKLEITKIQLPQVEFKVTCSKGTYIRKLCADIGDTLGCGAYQARLKRTKSGPFNLRDAITLKELADSPNPKEKLIPIDIALSHFPSVNARRWLVELLKKNAVISDVNNIPSNIRIGEFVRINGPDEKLLAIGKVETISGTGIQIKVLKLLENNV